MKTIRFNRWDCVASWDRYNNGRQALMLIDAINGDSIAKASVNLPDEPMAENEMAIKNYGENDGMLDALKAAGIVTNVVRYAQSGFVSIPICTVAVV